MKKVIGLIVLAIMVILPMKVNAAYSFEFKEIAEDDTTLTTEISVTITGSSTLSQIGGTLNMKHLTLGSVTMTDTNWTNISTGTSLLFKASTNMGAGTYKIATVTFNKDGSATATDPCYVNWTPCTNETGSFVCGNTPVEIAETYVCRVVNGTYYGKNGTVVTEDVYNSECVSNPQTGNFLPYIVIVTGIALAVIVFTVSRRNNKLYKI